MFRILVLCAYFAAASAGFLNPVVYSAPIGPLAYNGAIPYAPATTYISPAGYSQLGIAAAPLGFPHLIQKRDNQVPRKPHIPTFPVADDDGSVTVVKRSVAVLAPAAPDHLIHKRSAIAYAAPAAFAHQPGIGYGSPIIQSYAAAHPIGYGAAGYAAAPVGYGAAGYAATPIGYGTAGYAATPIGYASSYVAPAVAV